jgi:hypothetical protein
MNRLLLRLIQKLFLKVNTDIRPGDLVQHLRNDYVYEAVDIYYTFDLAPVLLMRDMSDGRLYGISGPSFFEYKRTSNVEKILEQNY